MNKQAFQDLKAAWDKPVEATLIQRRILDKKFLLRQWYEGIYCFISKNLKNGPVNVELGSGSSLLYKHLKRLIKTNILVIPGNDMAFDAYHMPFRDNSVDNLILISVFHHFDDPEKFLLEAMRILRPQGRILISDPYISILSYSLWQFLHPEGCNLSRIGFDKKLKSNPLLDANSANATLMFAKKYINKGPNALGFKVIKLRYHTIFHYWLAGGYNFPPLVPKWSLKIISLAESLTNLFGRLLASFMFVIVEKNDK